jgi:hypothetical protein
MTEIILPVDTFINYLIDILNICVKYKFVGAPGYIEKINRVRNFTTALTEEMIKKVTSTLLEYKTVLAENDFDYFNSHKIDLYDKDITDFFAAKWKAFAEDDKKKVFRLLKKMYNIGRKL